MEDQNSIPLTHCFLDTNVFLHFQSFDTVDWPNVLGAQHVCLVLTTTVMEELNRHKDDAKDPGRQKRAKEILSKLNDILPTDTAGITIPVGRNVTLLELLAAPDVDWKASKLDPQNGDDYLLGSILDFRKAHPEAHICLVTNDFPARRKALLHNISVVNPEGKITAREDFSDEAKERRKLERELQELKNRLPKLTFGFFEETTGKIVQYTTAPRSSEQNSDALAQAFDSQFVPTPVIKQQQRLDSILQDAIHHQISEYDIREFREKYEEYLERLEAACRREYLQKYGHRCRLDLILLNEGNAAATSVEVVLQFPAGSVVIRAQDEEEPLIIPDEPQPHWLRQTHSGFPSLLSLSPSVFRSQDYYTTQALYALRRDQQKLKGPFCTDTGDTHFVTYRAEELLHETRWELPPIIAYIWPTGASIDYQIYAKELPRKLEGKLHIRWTSK